MGITGGPQGTGRRRSSHGLLQLILGAFLLGTFLSSAPVSNVLAKSLTTLTLTISVNPVLEGQATRLNAYLSVGTETGTITFNGGPSPISKSVLRPGPTWVDVTWPLGTYTVSATYSGNGTFFPASSNTIQLDVVSAIEPTPAPTEAPTAAPTEAPTAAPTEAPTAAPTEAPTAAPTEAPTAAPTEAPTAAPTEAPTAAPTEAPTEAPTAAPTEAPTEAPTAAPTDAPTAAPTAAPTSAPTAAPTAGPTAAPTAAPTPVATMAPTAGPTADATMAPTPAPTAAPPAAPAVWLDSDDAYATGNATVHAQGFRAKSDVAVVLEDGDGTTYTMPSGQADASGGLDTAFDIPVSASEGEGQVELTGVDPSGAVLALTAKITIHAMPATDARPAAAPQTGGGSWTGLLMLMVLIATSILVAPAMGKPRKR